VEASARKWLQVHGGAVKRVRNVRVRDDEEECVPGRDLAGRLSTLLASLPALTSIGGLVLEFTVPQQPTRPFWPGPRAP